MKLILSARKNIANQNILKLLLERHPEVKKNIFEIPEDVLAVDKYADEILKKKPELLIVPSSHKSEAGIPTLTCHAPGNWTSGDLGGKPATLSIAPALYLREALLGLKAQKEKLGLNYEVSLEVTHHSPTIKLPVIFVEVGSSKKQWEDLRACEGVAEVIWNLFSQQPKNARVFVGFGGGHYAPTFTRRVFEGKVTFGHICPKYQLDKVSEKTFLEAFSKTKPKPEGAVLDWKGTSAPQRKKLVEIFEQHGIKWKRDKEVKF